MNSNYLFPYQFKKVGWALFSLGLILGIYFIITQPELGFLDAKVFAIVNEGIINTSISSKYFTIIENNLLDEIIGLLLIFGGIFIALSKEKHEDEFLLKIRLESLVWATYVNYFILVLALIFVYGFSFFWVLVFNMFTVLLFFVIRFNWVLYRSRKMIQNKTIPIN